MKKIWSKVAKDLWIILLDIIAINAAYYIALVMRFFVHGEFRPIAETKYIPAFLKFAPFYTVLCLLVFALFRLYGGMWRYVGINDMNRIIGASLVSGVIHAAGSLIFCRMPVTYYLIGAALQFLFIVLIRFAYRIILVEKKKISGMKTPAVPSMVIGAGETARKALHQLEDTPFRVTVVVDEKSAGKTMYGIPVVADVDAGLANVRAVFIADNSLSAEARKAIKEKTEAAGIELRDYTGYLSNLGGNIPVSALLNITEGPVTLVIDGQKSEFASGGEALQSLRDRYDVTAVRSPEITLRKFASAAYVGYEAWAQQHKEETGEDVSFF